MQPLLRSRKYRRLRRAVLIVAALGFLSFMVANQIIVTSTPFIRGVATHEARNLASAILMQSVEERGFQIKRVEQSYLVDQVNGAVADILKNAYDVFRQIEIGGNTSILRESSYEDGIIHQIPLGTVMNLPLLNIFGISFPVRMKLLGDIQGTVSTKLTPYGINNAMLEIRILLTANIQVISPTVQEEITVTQDLPLVLEIIQGDVPSYYPFMQTQQSDVSH